MGLPGKLGYLTALCTTVLLLVLCGCQGVPGSSSTGGNTGGGGSGSGSTAPAVSLSTMAVTFGNEVVGKASTPSPVTLTNTGTASLTLSNMAVAGTNSSDFAQTSNCGASVAAGASCVLMVTFTPTAAGTRNGSVTITDNATGSPQAVSLTGTGTPVATLQSSIQHIIFMAQENRSFDTYFGQLPAYWAANGYPPQAQFEGLPAGASNPSYDGTTTVPAYHVQTECIENLSPSWNESHVDWNRNDPTSATPTMDGFVYNAAVYAMNPPASEAPIYDTAGIRAMGYYDDSDLNYYYFMASNFATSDQWFAPALDRTQLNRMYLFAATSQGYAYPPGTNANDNLPLTAPTIFDSLQTAGVSWKVYATDTDPSCGDSSSGSTQIPYCTYLTQFVKYAPPNPLPANVVSATQFLSDAQNNKLPAVSFIEAGYISGLDEHPKNNVQKGAAYVASLIDGLMASPSWNDSVFILTWDEPGGLYDHVPPYATVNPDGIAPKDLPATDICGNGVGANCDFNYTGFRVPLIVISPFTKKNYVSHTPTDYTAILKFIETRFNLQPLTKRDNAQMDMTEFFDFANVPWATAPTPPTQATGGACNFQQLQ